MEDFYVNVCHVCIAWFSNEDQYWQHMKNYDCCHGGVENIQYIYSFGDRCRTCRTRIGRFIYECEFCDEEFDDISRLNSHELRHFVADQCLFINGVAQCRLCNGEPVDDCTEHMREEHLCYHEYIDCSDGICSTCDRVIGHFIHAIPKKRRRETDFDDEVMPSKRRRFF